MTEPSLGTYRKKRNFGRTAEPSGAAGNAKKKKTALKFAVQWHAASRLHFDLRLEWDGVLLSWAVPKGPSYLPSDKRLAVKVEDHPLDYAGFEGAIPKGEYGGGTVMLWDEGTWEPLTDVKEGLDTGSLKFELSGARLKGRWALVRLKPKDGEDGDNWLLIKDKDEFAREDDGISEFTMSVASGRSMDKIAADEAEAAEKNPFDRVEPELAKLRDAIPEDEGWLYEIKYDGYRILAFAENGAVRLSTRNDLDYTKKFAPAADAIAALSEGRAMVLDGEMTVSGADGKPDFGALQNYVKKADGKRLAYMVFDLLALDGKDLRNLPLFERKERLAELLKDAPAPVFYSKHVVGEGKELFDAAAKSGLEGVVGKRIDSAYGGNRDGSWIKIKCYRRQEFVVGGYTPSEKKDGGIAALLLGFFDNGKLVFAGRAGTGIDARTAAELKKSFAALETDRSPFSNGADVKRGEQVRYLKPKLVAEIQFAERTKENLLRQASFKGLRPDKDAKEVVWERPGEPDASAQIPASDPSAAAAPEKADKPNSAPKPETPGGAPNSRAPKTGGAVGSGKTVGNGSDSSAETKRPAASEKPGGAPGIVRNAADSASAVPSDAKTAIPHGAKTAAPDGAPTILGVKISSPDKIVFESPELTKLEVIRYYEAVAPRMMPYLRNRLLSVVRCHDGVKADCYYKKHPDNEGAGIDVVPVKNSEGALSDYFSIDEVGGLIAEAQSGTIEFHVWGSRTETLERPDTMVFDLDPDEGMPLERVRQGVRDLKSVLDSLSLASFLKTSGGKGYHVVVPFEPEAEWETFHDFSRRVAEVMEAKWPDRYTSNIRKIKRSGKIFIDWVRNGRGATSVAPFSLRARPGAKVAAPIFWKELDTVAPDGIDFAEALRRAKAADPWKDYFATAQKITKKP